MDLNIWLAFFAASWAISISPGAGAVAAMSAGLSHGFRRGYLTTLGLVLGIWTQMLVVSVGLGALVTASSTAFLVVKWAGVAYLVWLGIQLWRAPAMQVQALPRAAGPASVTGGRMFRQGLLAAISNPKVLLFYGAFLPQFIAPGRDLWVQFVVMAGTFAAVECLVEFGLASLAHRIRPWLQRTGRKFNRACGGLFGLMGAALPMTH